MAPITRKSSDAENTASTSRTFGRSRIASVTNIMRGASRRRRDRVYTKSTLNIKESLHRLKITSAATHRTQLASAPELPTPPTSPAGESSTIPSIAVSTEAPAPEPTRVVKEIRMRFPSILKRPAGRAVPTENLLSSLGPDFPPAQFVRDSLEATGLGSHMYRVSQSVEPLSLKGLPVLPQSFNLGIGDVSAPAPDRLLAVYKDGPVVNKTRTYTLMPVHDVVLATHCLAMPPLETTGIKTPLKAGEKLDLPTLEFAVPHPDSMRDIMRYLYLQDKTAFIGSLLPLSTHSPSASEFPGDTPIIRFGHLIAKTFTPFAIMRHLTFCHGTYRNMCYLGIRDDAAWQLLNIAWQVLLRGFAEATNQEEALKGAILD